MIVSIKKNRRHEVTVKKILDAIWFEKGKVGRRSEGHACSQMRRLRKCLKIGVQFAPLERPLRPAWARHKHERSSLRAVLNQRKRQEERERGGGGERLRRHSSKEREIKGRREEEKDQATIRPP